ncbi:MAG: sphingomyelin phosphodiesterase [Flavobacteriales bacterium]|nr:sphingomyelin phosphodiesterase [Flavobacteriales bacterium]
MRTPIIALLLAALTIGSAQAQTAEGIGTLNVLSWNIFMRPAGLFWNGQVERAKHIGALLKDSEYDVLLFQEAFSKKSQKVLREALGSEFPYEILPEGNGKFFNNGLWVLSRVPIENAVTFFYDQCMGVDCGAAKGAVFFEVKKDGFAYQLVNTHLQSEDGPEQIGIRNSQFAQIEQLLEKEAREGVLQLVAGDMNTSRANEDAYREMVTILNADDGDVCMPEDTYCASASATSWGCPNNTLIPDKWKGNSYLLDYALVRNPRPRVRPLPVWTDRVLRTFTSQWSSKHKHLSDHYAISISLVRE